MFRYCIGEREQLGTDPELRGQNSAGRSHCVCAALGQAPACHKTILSLLAAHRPILYQELAGKWGFSVPFQSPQSCLQKCEVFITGARTSLDPLIQLLWYCQARLLHLASVTSEIWPLAHCWPRQLEKWKV